MSKKQLWVSPPVETCRKYTCNSVPLSSALGITKNHPKIRWIAVRWSGDPVTWPLPVPKRSPRFASFSSSPFWGPSFWEWRMALPQQSVALLAVSLNFCLSVNIVILNTKTTLDTYWISHFHEPNATWRIFAEFRLIALNIWRISMLSGILRETNNVQKRSWFSYIKCHDGIFTFQRFFQWIQALVMLVQKHAGGYLSGITSGRKNNAPGKKGGGCSLFQTIWKNIELGHLPSKQG